MARSAVDTYSALGRGLVKLILIILIGFFAVGKYTGVGRIQLDGEQIFNLATWVDPQENIKRLLYLYTTEPVYFTLGYAVLYLFMMVIHIPGCTIMNMISGAMYGVQIGVLYASLLNIIGTAISWKLSTSLGPDSDLPFYYAEYFDYLCYKVAKSSHEGRRFAYLLFLRMNPFTRQWILNVGLPLFGDLTGKHVQISFSENMVTTCLGNFPWIYLAVKIGALLNYFTLGEIFNSTPLKVVVVIFIFSIPYWLKKLGIVEQ